METISKIFKSQYKKPEDQSKKIYNCTNEEAKQELCVKQIAYFQYKRTKDNFTFDFDKFLISVKDIQNATSLKSRTIWIKLMKEIIILRPQYKKSHYYEIMNVLFNYEFDEIELKMETIKIVTDNCQKLSHEYSSKILLFLCFECLMKSESEGILDIMINFLINYRLKEFEFEKKYVIYLIFEVCVIYAMNNICVYLQMQRMKINDTNEVKKVFKEIRSKIESEIQILMFYFFNANGIQPKKCFIDYLIIILAFFSNLEEEDKKYNDLRKLCNNDFLMRRIIFILNNNEEIQDIFCDKNKNLLLFGESFILLNSTQKAIISELKTKLGGLSEKIQQLKFYIIGGLLKFIGEVMIQKNQQQFIYSLIDIIKREFFFNNFKNEISLICDKIISEFGSKLTTEWSDIIVIIEKFNSDADAGLFESLVRKIYDLYMKNQIRLKANFLYELISKRLCYKSDLLNQFCTRCGLYQNDLYGKNIENYIVKSIEIFSEEKRHMFYVMNYIELFIKNEKSEKIISERFNQISEMISEDNPLLSKKLKKITILCLKETKNLKFFENFIKNNFLTFSKNFKKLQSISKSTNFLKKSIFCRKIIYKLIYFLNETYQLEKLTIIFNLFLNFLLSLDTPTNDVSDPKEIEYITTNIIFIFKKLNFIDINSKIYLCTSSISNFIISNDKFINAFISLLETQTNIVIKESIIELFSVQITNIYFFHSINGTKLINSLLSIPIEDFLQGTTMINHIRGFFMNFISSDVVLDNKGEIIKQIFFYLIAIINLFINRIVRGDNAMISSENSLGYLRIFLFVVAIYLDYLRRNHSMFDTQFLLSAAEQITKILERCFRIAILRKSFAISISNFVILNIDFFSFINSESIMRRIMFFMLNISFRDHCEELYNLFHSKISSSELPKYNNELKEMTKTPKNNKKYGKNAYINFLCDSVLLIYGEKYHHSCKLYYLLKEFLSKNGTEEKRNFIFIELCKWNAYFNGIERTCEIKNEGDSSKDEFYIGDNTIIVANPDRNYAVVRTPVYMRTIVVNDANRNIKNKRQSEKERLEILKNHSNLRQKNEDSDSEEEVEVKEEMEDDSLMSNSKTNEIVDMISLILGNHHPYVRATNEREITRISHLVSGMDILPVYVTTNILIVPSFTTKEDCLPFYSSICDVSTNLYRTFFYQNKYTLAPPEQKVNLKDVSDHLFVIYLPSSTTPLPALPSNSKIFYIIVTYLSPSHHKIRLEFNNTPLAKDPLIIKTIKAIETNFFKEILLDTSTKEFSHQLNTIFFLINSYILSAQMENNPGISKNNEYKTTLSKRCDVLRMISNPDS